MYTHYVYIVKIAERSLGKDDIEWEGAVREKGVTGYIYLPMAWACNTYAEIEKSCSFLVMSLSRCRTCVASASFNHCCVLLSASCAT